MIANHIHDALAQVRKLQEVILEKRNFRGYSGAARLMGGLLALAGAVGLGSEWGPVSPVGHLLGWGAVLAVALALNYGALAFWFLFNPGARRDLWRLLPAMDAIPPLAVGALLSVAFVVRGEYRLLFGTWMLLYGLVHTFYRQSLPAANYGVGIFYMLCGAVCLLHPRISFTHPWPMGLVFFVGETAGGFILYRNRVKE